ncbi:MAG: alpha/beta hydrolase [Bacilli bacterium]
MEYKYIKGNNSSTIILFHGTGGDINDLIPVAKFIDPDSNIISIKGEVVENGMNRYFKRFPNGSFDYKDLSIRTKTINDFIIKLKKDLDLSDNITAIGYSNGANLISSLLLNDSDVFKNAVLLHPTVIKEKDVNLKGINIYITYGDNDPICSLTGSLSLIEMYINKGANVDSLRTNKGHRVSEEELIKVKEWYEKI